MSKPFANKNRSKGALQGQQTPAGHPLTTPGAATVPRRRGRRPWAHRRMRRARQKGAIKRHAHQRASNACAPAAISRQA
jgi:hypothetical protein